MMVYLRISFSVQNAVFAWFHSCASQITSDIDATRRRHVFLVFSLQGLVGIKRIVSFTSVRFPRRKTFQNLPNLKINKFLMQLGFMAFLRALIKTGRFKIVQYFKSFSVWIKGHQFWLLTGGHQAKLSNVPKDHFAPPSRIILITREPESRFGTTEERTLNFMQQRKGQKNNFAKKNACCHQTVRRNEILHWQGCFTFFIEC